MALPLCTAETLFDGRWVSVRSPHPYTPAAVGEKLLNSNPAVDGGRYALATHNVTAAMRSPSGAPWEWTWEPSDCELPAFRAARFCKAARDTLLVGDSLIHQTYKSWAVQLGSPPNCETHRAIVGRCTASVCGGKVRLEYVHNKLCKLKQTPSWPPSHNSLGEYTPWAHAGYVSSFGAVIYGIGIFGLIMRRDDPKGHSDIWYAEHVNNVTDWLSANAAPSARLIFQAALPGASACGCAHEPGILPTNITSCATSQYVDTWCGQWAALPGLNREAAHALAASRGAGRVLRVDPTRMLELRPDAHRGSGCYHYQSGSSCAASGGGRVARPCAANDCLHWHMPGAIDVMPRVHQHLLDAVHGWRR